ncbi:glutamine amidotransferase [Arthrobacter zhangbolii]|uniref:Lipid II isoglutaminyl synthase (glutamine-hydrolyzing) subunit GatD n=1 Tax=Arthrobacter zhangbolii TaxID=2886936 RepID=A0A9X1M4Y5_9MICC|nr:glutamine amidotransferase [Arthrobacter zhangbolii]MCC3271341.1 glutamine amidotransferase [Arthrobacter zhangbolii]UON90876.1 glutamine amidotransferase [Arthrobacter zhangbolii]
MSADRTIRILQLYPREMNIYGDWGNVLVLKQRLKWYGYSPVVEEYNAGDEFPSDVDIIVGGGGQDSGQVVIQQDLQQLAPTLRKLADDGLPMLVICGLYQLFGKFFKTHEGTLIPGIGILDLETHGGDVRLIGNVLSVSSEFGEIHGYENHSGQTFLGPGVEPLAEVRKGEGNNTKDSTEGARYKNVVASYLHGSLLPKNPAIADFLIEQAAVRKFGSFAPVPRSEEDLADLSKLSDLARQHAGQRPR